MLSSLFLAITEMAESLDHGKTGLGSLHLV